MTRWQRSQLTMENEARDCWRSSQDWRGFYFYHFLLKILIFDWHCHQVNDSTWFPHQELCRGLEQRHSAAYSRPGALVIWSNCCDTVTLSWVKTQKVGLSQFSLFNCVANVHFWSPQVEELYKERLYLSVRITGILQSLTYERHIQGDFFHWYSPKKLKYGKPRGESMLT